MVTLIGHHPDVIHDAVAKYGSPLNVISTGPFQRNIESLNQVARGHDLNFRVFFARKANKCHAFVDAALNAGAGIDVASEQECAQALHRGAEGRDMVCTAAIKPDGLIRLCIENQVTIVIDNWDELNAVGNMTKTLQESCPLALRISGFRHEDAKLFSRFGFDIDDVEALIDVLPDLFPNIQLTGLHFHLDGYCPRQRVSAITQCLPLIDQLKAAGHAIEFLDIGGGLPMRYLESESEWNAFWAAHEQALRGNVPPVTWRNHGLGFQMVDGQLIGSRNLYPYYQEPIREQWLETVLSGPETSTGSIAEGIRQRGIQLRCEPGRSLLDGSGMTIARVEFCKQLSNGDHLFGLAMNRTQCRTGSDDFLVDPILLRDPRSSDTAAREGYLAGAYCTESDLILLRRLRFPAGIGRGDLIVLPNTAGYLMHFLESRSHQFALAKNVVLESERQLRLDAIDAA